MATVSFDEPIVIKDEKTAERLIVILDNPQPLDRSMNIDTELERGRALLRRVSSRYQTSSAR